ncbi:Conserved hypothetical protein CHP03843 [Candidatus Nanopelagicaceae bacterium]
MKILELGEITVEGRLVDASNATLLVEIADGTTQVKAIYKPVAGERPLWDFPDGNLASRERAAYLIDQALGFNHIPLTILRDGPFGFGMVQRWIDVDEEIDLELYFRQDDPQLREVALMDAVINNTDRKIGHLLPDSNGHLYVCDHGVTFHIDDKLRTVLWQWAGEQINEAEIEALENLLQLLSSGALDELNSLLTEDEIDALTLRINRLIASKRFPEPNPEWPHIPWPPF